MDYLLICSVAVLGSALTFVSGFGLGMLLLPAFLLFFPPQTAVAMTAVVHLANNLFKLALLWRLAKRQVVLRFGLPAIVAALAGAWLLTRLSGLPTWWRFEFLGRERAIEPAKAVLALLMIVFAVLEMLPVAKRWQFGPRWLPLGGVLSGFFGGLSGHQGAFRSVFLLRAGLNKEAFIATGAVIAVLVDAARLAVYGGSWRHVGSTGAALVVATTAAALTGALFGRWLLPKITLGLIRWVVALLLALIAVLLGLGVI